jgi:hypothetical protein
VLSGIGPCDVAGDVCDTILLVHDVTIGEGGVGSREYWILLYCQLQMLNRIDQTVGSAKPSGRATSEIFAIYLRASGIGREQVLTFREFESDTQFLGESFSENSLQCL